MYNVISTEVKMFCLINLPVVCSGCSGTQWDSSAIEDLFVDSLQKLNSFYSFIPRMIDIRCFFFTMAW